MPIQPCYVLVVVIVDFVVVLILNIIRSGLAFHRIHTETHTSFYFYLGIFFEFVLFLFRVLRFGLGNAHAQRCLVMLLVCLTARN